MLGCMSPPKISDSLLATVQCPRVYCHLLNLLAARSHFMWYSDIMGVHDKLLEPPCWPFD